MANAMEDAELKKVSRLVAALEEFYEISHK